MQVGDVITDGSVKWKLCRIDNAKTADSFNIENIGANEDLNNYINKKGIYCCPANSSAQSLKNKPSDLASAFILINSGSVPDLMIQFLYTYNTGCVYIRSNNNWNNTDHYSNWFKLTGSEMT